MQVPLHHNLPEERLPQRRADGRIRKVGYVGGGGEAEEGEGGGEGEGEGEGEGGIEGEIEDEGEIVISLGQLFFANYYSFLTDALARLVLARDALPSSQAAWLSLALIRTLAPIPTPTLTLTRPNSQPKPNPNPPRLRGCASYCPRTAGSSGPSCGLCCKGSASRRPTPTLTRCAHDPRVPPTPPRRGYVRAGCS